MTDRLRRPVAGRRDLSFERIELHLPFVEIAFADELRVILIIELLRLSLCQSRHGGERECETY
jgi:hypothetical protein